MTKELQSMLFLLLCFHGISAVAAPQTEVTQTESQPNAIVSAAYPAQNQEFITKWRAALHYFDESESEIEPSPFFLDPQGHEFPEKEFHATVAAFKNSGNLNAEIQIGPLKQSPYCAFPYRRKLLESIGYVFQAQACPDLDRFKTEIAAKSLTYVFSSAYPNNPASMFGHTFVRVNQGRNDPLRDYGINFAASVPPDEIGLVYIPKGLLGLYPGGFEIAPFFRKVMEYNVSESRDLWEYDLNFSESESQDFVLHIWELRWLSNIMYA